MKLFRDEAIDFQRSKLIGDVILYTPIKYSMVTAILFSILCITIYFFVTQEYKSKEKVSGYLFPKNGLSKITAERPSALKKLFVNVGDEVNIGDNLILLDTEKSLSSGQATSFEIQQSFDRELELINSRVESENSAMLLRRKQIDLLIKKLETDVSFMKKQYEILQKSKNISENRLLKLESLTKKSLVSKSLVDVEELGFLEYKQRLSALEMSILSKSQELASQKNEINLDYYRSIDSLTTLKQRKEQINQQKINSSSLEGYMVRSSIKGVVTSVFEAEGAQLVPGNVILIIQPENSKLIARLAVPSRSIGLLEEKQEVSIYYEAFPYQRFGVFKGKMSRISRNVINPREFVGPIEVIESFYFVDVELKEDVVTAYGKKIPLIAGMKLNADVITEKNSLFNLVISPIRALSPKVN